MPVFCSLPSLIPHVSSPARLYRFFQSDHPPIRTGLSISPVTGLGPDWPVPGTRTASLRLEVGGPCLPDHDNETCCRDTAVILIVPHRHAQYAEWARYLSDTPCPSITTSLHRTDGPCALCAFLRLPGLHLPARNSHLTWAPGSVRLRADRM